MVTVALVHQQEIRMEGRNEFAQFKKAFREFHWGLHKEPLEDLGPKVLKDLGLTDLPGRVEKLDDKPGPWFKKDDPEKHVYTSMEMKQTMSGDTGCDIHVLFDGDRARLNDPTVEMEARWREKKDGVVEMTQAMMRFKKSNSTTFGGDFEVGFNPQTGQMTALKAISAEMQNVLRAVMESERPGGVNSQGAIGFVENVKGFESACRLLGLHTRLDKKVFQDGFDVRRTLAQFIETGTVQLTGDVVSPVIVKKAS